MDYLIGSERVTMSVTRWFVKDSAGRFVARNLLTEDEAIEAALGLTVDAILEGLTSDVG